MIKTAIVLAGGLGSRLQTALNGLPKCLAPISGRPFIDYVISYWAQQGIENWVFALGHGAHAVQLHIETRFGYLQTQFSVETAPLGTGGAVRLAASLISDNHVLVLNADTLFKGQLQPAMVLHQNPDAICTLMLKPLNNCERYGTVLAQPNGHVVGFAEKNKTGAGNINAGCYLLNLAAFAQLAMPDSFSFEQDFLSKQAGLSTIFAQVQDQFFLDIGIPSDYNLAQYQIPRQFSVQLEADWTLFLDRDGVINIEKQNDYIHHWREFEFYPNAANTVVKLSQLFARTIVVTNQKGIGKGVTKAEDVEEIHRQVAAAVAREGGKIDAFFYCPDVDSNSPNRKPNPGMAHLAKAQFSEIDFARSLMVGNNISDLQFGRNAGMYTAYLRTTKPTQLLPAALADLEALDLAHLLRLMQHPL